MFKFWNLVLEPALKAVKAKRVIEIGVDAGDCTTQLLEYCAKAGGYLDYIDPCPSFDVVAAAKKYGASSQFHRGISLDVLPKLDTPDVAFIDGDHNWYTVYHELKALFARAEATGAGFPLVLFHDVTWPYGRRDLYYAPERIPVEFRQPYAQRGMQPGVEELLEFGGMNSQLCNAVKEGGPKNGVLTAIEDFVEETKVGKLYVIPAIFGLGMLVPKRLAKNEALRAEVRRWEAIPKDLIELVETDRNAISAWSHGEKQYLELQLKHATEHAAALREFLTDAQTERELLRKQRDELLAANAMLHDEKERLRKSLELIFQSHSWRLTSLVRKAGTILSGKSHWE